MAVKQLSDGGSDGTKLGQSAADLVGLYGADPVDQGAALTAQLTSITIADAAGTPDYAIQAVTNSTAYGFVTAAEAITFLYVVQNLQVRVAELEARLQDVGAIA